MPRSPRAHPRTTPPRRFPLPLPQPRPPRPRPRPPRAEPTVTRRTDWAEYDALPGSYREPGSVDGDGLARDGDDRPDSGSYGDDGSAGAGRPRGRRAGRGGEGGSRGGRRRRGFGEPSAEDEDTSASSRAEKGETSGDPAE